MPIQAPPSIEQQRIRLGDADAFEELFRLHYAELVRFAGAYLQDRAAAEDVVQDVFAALWAGRSGWVVTTTVRAYLYGAVRNRAINHHRRSLREVQYDSTLEAALDGASGPEGDLDLEELLSAFRDARAALPERRRQVYDLCRVEGMTYEEAAEVMGVSVNTIRTQIMAAMHFLRDRLRPFL
jgi:RNA polymerase sigma-70 factor, ECF subfamily